MDGPGGDESGSLTEAYNPVIWAFGFDKGVEVVDGLESSFGVVFFEICPCFIVAGEKPFDIYRASVRSFDLEIRRMRSGPTWIDIVRHITFSKIESVFVAKLIPNCS